jgi:actin-related protein 8
MSLSFGGDDITEFFSVLLERIKFPYRELDLNRSYDWNIMEDLKIRLCTLADVRCQLSLFLFNLSHDTD